ncbi:molybdenum cofactor guanylyltransferase [Mobilicoccus pelagius]|uniref:Putative molybdenum cofactor biosynthesis protein n=1 Tax=Mobilicoccus pelagius NBRC 104925 TaxID=1089455 RepID=H5UW07_9MICO|nr:NTP transferase domain-containing protein [Mobilicoccus pelagius]GAB49915.1 putative molybdenum cofactor biosynthesis protein [Mobilicoccus pelagius NBRC 104925]
MISTPPDASAPPDTAGPQVTAVVLCGGTSARMGGGDKTASPLGGGSVLEALLTDLPREWSVVCVGEERPVCREVAWARERPALGGPVAGLAAGLVLVDTPIVAVLAGDQPFAADAARRTVVALVEAPESVDGVMAAQTDGRGQPLLAAYRTGALRGVIPADPAGSGVHRTVASLRLAQVAVAPCSTLDVDTPDDLDRARRLHDDRAMDDDDGAGRRPDDHEPTLGSTGRAR